MKWYEIKNKSDKAEIYIYEMIGEDFFGDGLSAKGFQKDLSAIKANQIDLHLNSPGGEVFDGLAIYNLLLQHPAKVTTYVDGIAASIVSVIALAGDTVHMAENALFMIHNPRGMSVGGAEDMRKMAERLDVVRGSISKAYISKTGKPEDEIHDLMDVETWMTADEAIELGFADEITAKIDMAACAEFVPVMEKAGFKNIPQIINGKKELTARDAETALRDVGFSKKVSKRILAEGFYEGQRDADPPEPNPRPKADQRDVDPPKSDDPVNDLLIRAGSILK